MKLYATFFIALLFFGCASVQNLSQIFEPPKQASQEENPKIIALKEAYEAHDEKKFSSAYNLFKREADKGNDEAMYMLGFYNVTGEAGVKDYNAALHYFRLAASQVNAKALRMAGYMYENGMGTKKDIKKAQRYYELSVAAGEMLAFLVLASCF